MGFKLFNKGDDQPKTVWVAEDLEKYWSEGSTWRKADIRHRKDVVVQSTALRITGTINMILIIISIFVVIIACAIFAKASLTPPETIYFYDGTTHICKLDHKGNITTVTDNVKPPTITNEQARFGAMERQQMADALNQKSEGLTDDVSPSTMTE